MRALTLKEYERISVGKEEDKAEKWAYVRAIESAIINFGGMGAKNYINETDTRPIPLIDNINIVLPLRTKEQAYKIIDKWLD